MYCLLFSCRQPYQKTTRIWKLKKPVTFQSSSLASHKRTNLPLICPAFNFSSCEKRHVLFQWHIYINCVGVCEFGNIFRRARGPTYCYYNIDLVSRSRAYKSLKIFLEKLIHECLNILWNEEITRFSPRYSDLSFPTKLAQYW